MAYLSAKDDPAAIAPWVLPEILLLLRMVVLPCSSIQVALAFDIGILQMVRPGAQRSRTTFGNGFEVWNLRFEMGEGPTSFNEAEHGAYFSCLATGDIEKRQYFIRGASLETLGNVVGDGEGGSFQLVSQAATAAPGAACCHVIDALRQTDRLQPDRKFFESGIGHAILPLVWSVVRESFENASWGSDSPHQHQPAAASLFALRSWLRVKRRLDPTSFISHMEPPC
jgi:hypothetical protein